MEKDTPELAGDSATTVYHDEARAAFAERRVRELERRLREIAARLQRPDPHVHHYLKGIHAEDCRGCQLLRLADPDRLGMPEGLSWDQVRDHLAELTHGRATEEQMNLMVTGVLAGDMKLVRTADGWLPVMTEQLEVWP